MTVNADPLREDYLGADATDTFDYGWRITAATDLRVVEEDDAGIVSVLALDVDYTVAGVGLFAGGSITRTAGNLPSGHTLTILDAPATTQGLSLRNRGGFFPEDHEDAFDRLTRIDRHQDDQLARAMKFPETDGTGLNTVLPSATVRANQLLGFDANGEAVASQPSEAIVSTFMQDVVSAIDKPTALTELGFSAYIQTLVDDATAAAARGTLKTGAIGIPENYSLDPSVDSNALTMAVKTAAGTDPSSTDPISVLIPDGAGAVNRRTITSATSFIFSSGSTAGHADGLKQYLYWYAIDNSGTVELAASSKFFGWHGTVTTTAEGGAGAADSGTVMYSTTARTSVPFVCIGYTEDTQTTAGTWATAPSAVRLAPFSHPSDIQIFVATDTSGGDNRNWAIEINGPENAGEGGAGSWALRCTHDEGTDPLTRETDPLDDSVGATQFLKVDRVGNLLVGTGNLDDLPEFADRQVIIRTSSDTGTRAKLRVARGADVAFGDFYWDVTTDELRIGVKNEDLIRFDPALPITSFYDFSGTPAARFIVRATEANPRIELPDVDNGNSIGPRVLVGRNDNASTPAAGVIQLRNRAGTGYFLWVDNTGDLRIGTTDPTNADDTSGTVVGTQT